VHNLPGPLKRDLGRGIYVVQALRETARYHFTPLALRIDGDDMRATNVIVSKGRLYGGSLFARPRRKAGRPGFTVAAVEHGGALAFLAYDAALPLNMLPRAAGFRLLPAASRIDIACPRSVPAQTDADAAGTTPLLPLRSLWSGRRRRRSARR
jgi:diacylglycerol kinase (ATP)